MDAIKLQRFAHKLYKKRLPGAGLIHRYIHFRYNCDISPMTSIGEGTKLGHGGIGCVINSKAIIGRMVTLAQNVTIAGKDGLCPEIDDWSYIGANSVVLGGVKVGKNVFVGALSLVNKDVPDGAVVAGIPAKVIRMQTPEEIDRWHQWVLKNRGRASNSKIGGPEVQQQ